LRKSSGINTGNVTGIDFIIADFLMLVNYFKEKSPMTLCLNLNYQCFNRKPRPPNLVFHHSKKACFIIYWYCWIVYWS